MKAKLEKMLADGQITQDIFDNLVASIPDAPEAWTARETAHAAELAKLTKERDDAVAREAAKDKIIVSFSTQGNPTATPEANAMVEVVKYINKKRGI